MHPIHDKAPIFFWSSGIPRCAHRLHPLSPSRQLPRDGADDDEDREAEAKRTRALPNPFDIIVACFVMECIPARCCHLLGSESWWSPVVRLARGDTAESFLLDPVRFGTFRFGEGDGGLEISSRADSHRRRGGDMGFVCWSHAGEKDPSIVDSARFISL